MGCNKSPNSSEEPCARSIHANNEAETLSPTSKPAPPARLLSERHSGPVSPRGDKRLKPLPTTTQQRKVRPRNPRRPLDSCGRGVHANNEAETRSSISKPAPPARLLWERRPMLFVTVRGRASPPRGDKRLKPLPTTTQQRKVRPRNPRRPLDSCGRGVHARSSQSTTETHRASSRVESGFRFRSHPCPPSTSFQSSMTTN